MCSELFRIPYAWGGVPIFGFGVLLAIWAVASAVTLVGLVRRHGWSGETWSSLPVLLLVGAAIVFLPRRVSRRAAGSRLRRDAAGRHLRGRRHGDVSRTARRARSRSHSVAGDLAGGLRRRSGRGCSTSSSIGTNDFAGRRPARNAARNPQHSRRRAGDLRRLHRRGGRVLRLRAQAQAAAAWRWPISSRRA